LSSLRPFALEIAHRGDNEGLSCSNLGIKNFTIIIKKIIENRFVSPAIKSDIDKFKKTVPIFLHNFIDQCALLCETGSRQLLIDLENDLVTQFINLPGFTSMAYMRDPEFVLSELVSYFRTANQTDGKMSAVSFITVILGIFIFNNEDVKCTSQHEELFYTSLSAYYTASLPSSAAYREKMRYNFKDSKDVEELHNHYNLLKSTSSLIFDRLTTLLQGVIARQSPRLTIAPLTKSEEALWDEPLDDEFAGEQKARYESEEKTEAATTEGYTEIEDLDDDFDALIDDSPIPSGSLARAPTRTAKLLSSEEIRLTILKTFWSLFKLHNPCSVTNIKSSCRSDEAQMNASSLISLHTFTTSYHELIRTTNPTVAISLLQDIFRTGFSFLEALFIARKWKLNKATLDCSRHALSNLWANDLRLPPKPDSLWFKKHNCQTLRARYPNELPALVGDTVGSTISYATALYNEAIALSLECLSAAPQKIDPALKKLHKLHAQLSVPFVSGESIVSERMRLSGSGGDKSTELSDIAIARLEAYSIQFETAKVGLQKLLSEFSTIHSRFSERFKMIEVHLEQLSLSIIKWRLSPGSHSWFLHINTILFHTQFLAEAIATLASLIDKKTIKVDHDLSDLLSEQAEDAPETRLSERSLTTLRAMATRGKALEFPIRYLSRQSYSTIATSMAHYFQLTAHAYDHTVYTDGTTTDRLPELQEYVVTDATDCYELVLELLPKRLFRLLNQIRTSV